MDVFPSVRWVFPQAEDRLAEIQGVEVPQWFDVWNMLDFTDNEELQVFGLRESVESLRRIVRAEAQRVGGLHRVFLAGISQGGATAVHTLLHLGHREDGEVEGVRPSRLGGLIGFCPWLPFPGGSLQETREVLGLEEEGGLEVEGEEEDKLENDDFVRRTPAFLGHCADDPIVFVEYGKQLRDALRGFGMDVSWHEYPSGGHWINSPKGVDDVVEFLKTQGIPAAE